MTSQLLHSNSGDGGHLNEHETKMTERLATNRQDSALSNGVARSYSTSSKSHVNNTPYASEYHNNSNNNSSGGGFGLTMRVHQNIHDDDDNNNNNKNYHQVDSNIFTDNPHGTSVQQHQQQKVRPRSDDYSYYKSGTEYSCKVSGKEFQRPSFISTTAAIATTPTSSSRYSGTTAANKSGPGGSGTMASPTGVGAGGVGTEQIKGSSPSQKRVRANLLRVRIERGLMVGMALLAGYRMMTLDCNAIATTTSASTLQQQHQRVPTSFSSPPASSASLLYTSTSWSDSSHSFGAGQQQPWSQQDAIPGLARSAWALGAGFILLALVHTMFLTAHDRQLQFPLHNKNLPLQPIRKRSSRYLNTNAPQAVATAAIEVDSDDDSEDDETLQRDIAEIQQENSLNSPEGGPSGSGQAGTQDATSGSWHGRFCRSAELAIPQWRVWGSEAHWYRRGADNGSIFATVLVPVVLAAKFVQTVTDEKFLTTGTTSLRTAESVLADMAFSLIFGASVLVHMLLLKAFDQTGKGSTKDGHHRQRKDFTTRSTLLDSIFLPPPMTIASTLSASMSTHSLSTTSSGLSKYLYPGQRQSQAISSPSSPSSPSLSAVSSTLPPFVQQSHAAQRQQDIQDAFMFSADQLHHPSLLMSPTEAEKTSEREEVWIIALGFGGAFTFLITLLARFKWLPGLENTGAGMVMLNQSIFQALMIGFAYFFRRSFTFGELTILAQAITLLIHETLLMTFVKTPPNPGQVLEHPQFMFLLMLVVGMLLIGVLLTPVLMYCRRLAQTPTKGASQANLQKRESKKKIAAGGVYAGLVVIVLGLIMPVCERILGQNPFLWLIEFMLMTRIFGSPSPELVQPGQSPVETMVGMGMGTGTGTGTGTSTSTSTTTTATTMAADIKFGLETLMSVRIGWSRLALCFYWVTAIGCSIAFFYWMNTSIRRRSIMGSLNNRRKFYHALAVLMFIPGYLADEPFMHIAFSVSLAALIFLEYIRYFAVVPFGKELHLFLVGFLDARDGGPIILSHLYLLMGCAAPVWLAEQHILAGLSGIFALGVGDAMASIVGKRFGKHRWPGTIKTMEGTAAFVVSMMVAAGLVFVGMWLMSFVFVGAKALPRPSSVVVVMSKASNRHGGSSTSTFRPPASLLSFSTWNDWSSVTWSVSGVVRYGLAVSVAAMLEAVSEQNDNLVIPVVMLAMVWLI